MHFAMDFNVLYRVDQTVDACMNLSCLHCVINLQDCQTFYEKAHKVISIKDVLFQCWIKRLHSVEQYFNT